MNIGWQGTRIQLVPLEHDRHFENCYRWINDPVATAWTLMGDWPMSRLVEEEWFTQASRANGTDVVFAIETLEGEHIGTAGLHAIDWRHGVAKTGTLIGPAERRGQGLGSEAIALRTRYAFDCLGLRLLLSEVYAENTVSLRALAKAGYQQVGRIPRRYWKRGAWRDMVLLACERPSGLAATGEGP